MYTNYYFFFILCSYIASIAITGFLLVRMHAMKSKSAIMLRHSLICTFLTAITCSVAMQDTLPSTSMLLQTIISMISTWNIFFFVLFCRRITDEGNKVNRFLHIGYRLLVVADSISLIINYFTGCLFQIVLIDPNTNQYAMLTYSPYVFHYAICYGSLIYSFTLLLVTMRSLPRIYWSRYYWITLCLGLLIIWDAASILVPGFPNLNVIGYALAGLFAYHLSLDHVPVGVTNQILSLLSKQMDYMFFFFDQFGRCLYMNDSACEFLKTDLTRTDDILDELSEKLTHQLDLQEDSSFEIELQKDGKTLTYAIKCSGLTDEDGNALGRSVLIFDYTKEYEAYRRTRYHATHDRLTGTYNKDYFIDQAEKLLNANPTEEYLMITSDVKDFKLINDTLGTSQGDRVLKRIADILRNLTRDKELYCRLGGDRFALLMPRRYFDEEVFIRNSTDMIQFDQMISYPVNVYFGVYAIEDRTLPVATMIDRSFIAINSVKGISTHRIGYYDDSMRSNALRAQQLTAELDAALRDEDFLLYLQPQVTVEREVSGAEVLIRWNHPVNGLMMPGSFLPIFEQNGQIAKIDYYIWEHTCILLRKWIDAGVSQYLSVNISPTDFMFYNIYDVFTELVQKYQIPPNRLRLEITETAIIHNIDETLILIKRLQDYGFYIEMDDFGSGYSSLNTLKDIPVDALKVDMKFLSASKNVSRSRIILSSILAMAKELKLSIITEGVETEDQVVFLREHGTDMYQGFYFAKPMPIEDYEHLYLK